MNSIYSSNSFKKFIMFSLLIFLNMISSEFIYLAKAQSVSIMHKPIRTSIKRKDIVFKVEIKGSQINKVMLNVRRLLDLGPFTQMPFESKSANKFEFLLPLSQENSDTGRLEYFIEAYKDNTKVAETQKFIISFIDAPYIGEARFHIEPPMEKDEFKDFIRGKKPWWKKWQYWAIGVVVVGGAAAYFASQSGDSTTKYEPPTITLKELSTPARAGIYYYADQDIIIESTIGNGEAPYTITFYKKDVERDTEFSVAGDITNIEKESPFTETFIYRGGLNLAIPTGATGDRLRNYDLQAKIIDGKGNETISNTIQIGLWYSNTP